MELRKYDLPKYDLHCHSRASDGALTPAALLDKAMQNGIEVLALTDHDTVRGCLELLDLPQEEVKIISGMELTCLWNQRVLHVVGLGFDPECQALENYLQHLSVLRERRALKIAQQLICMKLPDLYEDAKALAGEGAIGRPHFARAMLNAGVVDSEQQAFKKYLGIGKKGDVKMEWPSLQEAVDIIKSAGGIAVLAHPTKYKMTFTKLRLAINDFVEVGGEAIEVSYTGMTPDHHLHLLRIAKERGLYISAGSDFHAPSQGWTDLGKYPPLKTNSRHILTALLGWNNLPVL